MEHVMRFLRLSVTHPSELALMRFASNHTGADDPTNRAGVARHLVRCESCREVVQATRAIAQSARAFDGPEPPRALLERVIAERSAGARVLLPSAHTNDFPRTNHTRRMRAIVAAAVTALVVGGIGYQRAIRAPNAAVVVAARGDTIDSAPPTFAGHAAHREGFFTVSSLLPTAAYAQSPSARTAVIALDPRRLRAGRWTYELQLPGRDSGLREQAVVEIAPATQGGRRQWGVYDAWLGHPDDMVDSVFYDAESLQLARRAARRVGPSQYTISQRFVGDSIVGVIQATRYRAPTAQPIRRVLPRQGRRYGAGDGFLHVFFLGAQLDANWHAQVALVGWGAVPSDLVYPVDLRVTGDTTLTITGLKTPAWTVAMSSGVNAKTVWIRKRDGVPLRIVGNAGAERGWIIALVQERTDKPASDGAPRAYRLDASHSDVGFAVGFMHGMQVRGRFDELRGTLLLDAAHPDRSSVSMVVGVKSINTGSSFRDQHLRSKDFFDVATFPRMTFISQRIQFGRRDTVLTGDLSMHGVTREVRLPVHLRYGPESIPQGHSTVGFSGTLRIARKDFGILGGSTFNSWFDDIRSATLADSVDVTLDLGFWDADFAVERDAVREAIVARVRERGIDAVLSQMRAMPADAQERELPEWSTNQAARQLLQDGRRDDAIRLLTFTIERFPSSAAAHAYLGHALETVDQNRARAEYDRAIALDPAETFALEWRRRLGR